jgi:hypothetical protein
MKHVPTRMVFLMYALLLSSFLAVKVAALKDVSLPEFCMHLYILTFSFQDDM